MPVSRSVTLRWGSETVTRLGMMTREEAAAVGAPPVVPQPPTPVPVVPQPPPIDPPPAVDPPTPVPIDPRDVREFGAKGDGVTDDRAAIQRAFDALEPGDTLLFPAGAYNYTIVDFAGALRLRKSGVTILGANGAELRPTRASSLVEVVGCRDVTLRNLVIRGIATARSDTQAQNGFTIKDSHFCTIEACEAWSVGRNVVYVANATKGAPHSTNIRVLRCKGQSYADGIHIEGADDVLVDGCELTDTGDDAISSIGYAFNGPNLRPVIRNNRVTRTRWARGIAMEGTIDGLAEGNYIEGTAHAGMICQSTKGYPTGESRSILFRNNEIVRCSTANGQGGIHVAAEGFNVQVHVENNRITSLPGKPGINVVGYGGFKATVTKSGNTVDGRAI